MNQVKIRRALLSVYSKEGVAPLVEQMHKMGIELVSTGGTQRYIEQLGIPVQSVESLTDFPSILDGRVKTLHPMVFAGILARPTDSHQQELESFNIQEFDCIVVDLYPFEETVANEDASQQDIIEKIDIGGIALIRAAAKNYERTLVVPSKEQYGDLMHLLTAQEGLTELEDRKRLATEAFGVSSSYDQAIFQYLSKDGQGTFSISKGPQKPLRYGENPHQNAHFYGPLSALMEQCHGKDLSYNNLVDVDAAFHLMREFVDEDPTIAVLKHTNPCGIATRSNVEEAWHAALAGDPVSAFGGIIIANHTIDSATATAIDSIFYEVVIAPDYSEDALSILQAKKKRIILRVKHWNAPRTQYKSLLNGVIEQDMDHKTHDPSDWSCVTQRSASPREIADLHFANRVVKHLKSNTIAIVKNHQLIGMGCGQTSRVDALQQAIHKAKQFGFEPKGAVMASDAFFPFPDCVEIAHKHGIQVIVQPGGSIKDQDSIDYCDAHEQAMYLTSFRHFKH